MLSYSDIYCAGDRLAQKMSSYVESKYYVKMYDVLWSVLSYSGIACAYDRMAHKMSSYLELSDYLEVVDVV